MVTARTAKAFVSMATLAFASAGYVRPVTADLVRWNLQNVTFNDGGVATGFFLADTTPAENSRPDFDIKVTGGKFPSFEYTPQSAGGSGHGNVPFPGGLIGPNGPGVDTLYSNNAPYRFLRLITPLAPATLPVIPIRHLSSLSDFSSSEGINGDIRWVLTGSLTTGIPQPPNHGTLVRWILDGVKFDNGGTVTGSFIYDASSRTVVDFNFHSDEAAGSTVIGDISQSYPCGPHPFYPVCWSGQSSTGALRFDELNPSPSAGSFDLIVGNPLTDKGGAVPLTPGGHTDEGLPIGSGFRCCRGGADYRIVAGVLIGTVVPEPSETLFLAFGLAALVGFSVWQGRALTARCRSTYRADARTEPAHCITSS